MTTANGYPLIAMPKPWRLVSVDWTLRVPITVNTSPYTGQSQIIKWPGADSWAATVTTPPLTPDEARDWTSFLWDAQGGAVAFLLGDPLRRTPRGSVSTLVTVHGINAASGSTIALKGFRASQARVFVRGDLISANNRLYQIRDQYVSADPSGNATVTVSPSLREALTDSMPVATHDAQGMFRMAKSSLQYSSSKDRNYQMSFPCVEAR